MSGAARILFGSLSTRWRGSAWHWSLPVKSIAKNPIVKTASVGVLGQLARPLVTLMTMPALLSALGKEGLGVWLIALSIMGMVGFVTAGLSAAVVTAIARVPENDAKAEIAKLTSCASSLALGWGSIVAVLGVPFAILVDWHRLLGLSAAIYSDDVTKLMVVMIAMLASGFIAVVPRQVMLGRQHGYLAHALDLSGVVAGAIALIIAVTYGAPLWLLGLAFLVPQYTAAFLGGLFYLRNAGIPLIQKGQVDRATLRWLGKEGTKMSAYQAAFAASSQSDLLLLGILLGAPASAVYGIAQRVFSLPVLISSSVNYAQWPAMARADAAGEHEVVGRIYVRTLLIGSATATLAAGILAAYYDRLVIIWLGRSVPTDALLITGMVCWVLVVTLVNTSDTLLRARQETTFVMRCMFAMMFVNLTTTISLLHFIGSPGAIWGNVIGFFTCLLVPYKLKIRRDTSNLK